ncbi:MAG: hypothetical protein LQ352_000480 [Teloschistes flavicans]|nr:MAG: hypothetical protein LQ352_000480 [Teloschistes flavicans]
MGQSIDSSRPIMAPSVSSKRTSKRFSTYSSLLSDTTTLRASTHLSSNTHNTSPSSASSSDPRLQEIKEWSTGFERLDNKHLQKQRYQPTPEKSDNLSKLALGAKVERALGRRMTDQDAVFRTTKVVSEKPATVTRSVTTAS